MVNPIQITQPQAYSGGADFTPLSKLYDVYKASQERARQEAALGQLGEDPMANARILAQSGSLPTVQLGLGMQDKEIVRRREDIANQQAQQNFMMQQKLREAEEARAKTKADVTLPILQSEEQRAAVKFAEAQKYSTREARLQAVKDGELNINDPEIRRWVALGGEIPDPAKNRLGLGAPTYTRDAEGNLRAYQLSATGQPVEVKFGEGQKILGPGEIAQQRAEGAGTGKAITAAKVGLPELNRTLDNTAATITELLNHPGKSMALGRGSQLPDWMTTGTDIGDFRVKVAQLAGEAMQQSMASLKGAGLGSVSDFEQKNMMNAFIAASTAQTEKAFTESMQKGLRSLDKIREVARAKAKGDFSEKPGTAVAPATAATGGDVLAKARAAIQGGADPKAVRQRLIDAKINPGDIGL